MESFSKVWQRGMLEKGTEKRTTNVDRSVLPISSRFLKGSLAMFTNASINLS